MNRFLTAAAEVTPESDGSGGMTFLTVVALACVVFGIFLIVGKEETLEKSRMLTGGRMKMDKVSLSLTRLTGIQLAVIGALLIACIFCMNSGFYVAGLVLALLTILFPIPFTIYRKKSKRFK